MVSLTGTNGDLTTWPIIMKLPFLKARRTPRIATDAPHDKLVNASPDEVMESHCSQEIMDAVKNKDVTRFHSAITALIMNMFDWENEDADKA